MQGSLAERMKDLVLPAKGRINIMSIFNGISCGAQALRELGLELGEIHVCDSEDIVNLISKSNFDGIRMDVLPSNAWLITKEHVEKCGPIQVSLDRHHV